MRRIISILMENEPGALSRVVGLFSQRGYNIETPQRGRDGRLRACHDSR
jgi:acetolactate synthase small subunit